ncbi:hypothetical protein AVEN_98147-1 [Araneus ventricosus]|uniref:Uncharacterized protein n=1 Tax=Araneus ventricosus TaxID=182803 RepID=A0A4Y2MQ33_ARAVE|nr:hypothetical protein AVEN_98147-1 [Araneus ventricosus]
MISSRCEIKSEEQFISSPLIPQGHVFLKNDGIGTKRAQTEFDFFQSVSTKSPQIGEPKNCQVAKSCLRTHVPGAHTERGFNVVSETWRRFMGTKG